MEKRVLEYLIPCALKEIIQLPYFLIVVIGDL